MDEPVPGHPQPGPPDVRFPEPAVPGAPPPLLPRPTFPGVSLPPEQSTAPPLEDSWSLPYVDPALTSGLAELEQWSSRIQVAVEPGWSAVTLLRCDAPMRHVEAPRFAFIDEMSLAVTAVRAPEAALPEAPAGTALLSRLRMLHERFVPGFIRYPVDAQWHELGGVPAVLDRLSTGALSLPSAFSLAAEVSGGHGMVVFGYAPKDRHATVTGVAIPLALMAEPTETGIRWVLPRGWSGREELQLVSETVIAHARLEPLLPGWGLAEWTDEVFARAPFLRDLRRLGDREVTVPGVDLAWLARFDWQPSGRGRMLTTVVTGVTGDHGFSFVIEVPLETGSQFHTTDPDAVLAMLTVAADASPATSRRGPDGSSESQTPATVLPPISYRSDDELRLLAGVDRAVIAAVDIAAEAHAAVEDRALIAYDPEIASVDVAAIASTTDELMAEGNPSLVLDRLASWAASALPLLPEKPDRTYRVLLLGDGIRPVEMLMTAAAWARDKPEKVVARWIDMIDAGDASPKDAFWATALLITDAVAGEGQRHADDRGSLAVVLDQVRCRLPLDPHLAWDTSVPSTPVPRPLRYSLRAFFDDGSGVLLWASTTPEGLNRWDPEVDHYELPISKALADTIDGLVVRYNDASEQLHWQPRRPFTDDERREFVASYFATIEELRWALGPAYEIQEDSRFPRS